MTIDFEKSDLYEQMHAAFFELGNKGDELSDSEWGLPPRAKHKPTEDEVRKAGEAGLADVYKRWLNHQSLGDGKRIPGMNWTRFVPIISY